MPLEARDKCFYLDGRRLQIVSGAVHYFRIVPEYWRDRLSRLKAAGLNCVETYVAWNLHEPRRGHFNFTGMLDIRRYIEIAQELQLYVIVRPGPYICAEWDFGGLPSWLLRDANMKVRSSYQPFLDAVECYMTALMTQLDSLQHSSGGPIIAVQVENEYGSYGDDAVYKTRLTDMFKKVGVRELLFTSDNGMGLQTGQIPGVLMTANFQEREHGELMLQYLRHVRRQVDMPVMITEYWTGWFDHWTEKHHVVSTDKFEAVLRWIVTQGGSVNLYMFHGGTNFGFMAGANEHLGATNESTVIKYSPDVTSYDYDAPLAENGDVTDKFHAIRRVLCDVQLADTDVMDSPVPAAIPSKAYGDVKMTQYLELNELLTHVECVKSSELLTMEQLPINDDNGQSYGFTLYRTSVDVGTRHVKFTGQVRDRALVMVNGREVDVVDWTQPDHVTSIESSTSSVSDLAVLVENCGRVNYADFNSQLLNNQHKGLKAVDIDGLPARNWSIFPLEFSRQFLDAVSSDELWHNVDDNAEGSAASSPRLYRATLSLSTSPCDTFINMTSAGWTKGVVFVNGFNIGRYWNVGPQRTLYVPAPLLTTGDNQLMVFELHPMTSRCGHMTLQGRADLGDAEEHGTIVPWSAWLQLTALRTVLRLGDWVWAVLRLFLR